MEEPLDRLRGWKEEILMLDDPTWLALEISMDRRRFSLRTPLKQPSVTTRSLSVSSSGLPLHIQYRQLSVCSQLICRILYGISVDTTRIYATK